MKQEMMGWHRGSGISWTICKSFAPHFQIEPCQCLITQFLQAGSDALPDAQPAMSTHRREASASLKNVSCHIQTAGSVSKLRKQMLSLRLISDLCYTLSLQLSLSDLIR